MNLPWLDPGDPFPDPTQAWDASQPAPGLLAAGGALDLDSLLAWQSFVPDIADAAAFGAGARPVPGTVLAPPGPEQTAIEIPYRLQLSPTGSAGWAHDGSAPADTATPIWLTRPIDAWWAHSLMPGRPVSRCSASWWSDRRMASS